MVRYLLFICSFFLYTVAKTQNCTYQLSGTVSDIDTKQPLEQATVVIKENGKTTVTDAGGFYRFKELCIGTYTVIVTHASCLPIELKVKLEGNLVRNFVMPHNFNQLQEIILQGYADKQPDAIKSEINKAALQQTRGLTLGEVLRKVDGVTVLQTGSTIYKPVIHGLHSQRVLIINNGVRQEGQQWGSEHAPEVDPFIADKFIVLKGAGALRYGADAIGGAILVEPKALPTLPGLKGEVNTVLFSNNRMGVFNAMLEQNLKQHPQWSWRLQGTFKKGGNTRTPDYWLYNTGVEEINYSANVGYRKENFRADVFFSAFTTKLGIFWGSHVGNLTDLETAINAPKPILNIDSFSYQISRPRQEVRHYLVKGKFIQQLANQNKLNLIVAHQDNFRKEFDRALISNRPELDLNISTTTIDFNYERSIKENKSGSSGIIVQRQANIWDGSRFFIPNFTSWMAGAYVTERRVVGSTALEAGLRYDYRTQRVFRNQNNVVTETFRSFNNVSGSFSVNAKLSNAVRWLTNVSLAWRPPSINELYVNGLHHGTANFEIGDPNLKSETGYNLSTQLKVEKDSSYSFHLTVFSNYIQGFINLVPSVPPTLTLRGAYPTFRFIQTNAWLTGADISFEKNISAAIQVSGKASLLLPRDVKAGTWLQQMPSQRFESDLTWYFRTGHPKQTYVTANVLWVTRQTLVPANALDYLPPPAGYVITNLEYATLLHINKKHLNFAISIYNLFNSRYRDYMNRFRYFNDEAGRNIVLRVKFPLG